MTGPRVRTAVLISGRGSNMEALIAAARDPAFPAEIVLAASNRPEAQGLLTAASMGVAAVAVDHRPYGKDRGAHEAALNDALQAADIELIALAGYMRVLTGAFTKRWAGRMLNIHPSLLPLYPGLDTHRRALEAGDVEAGCTVHLVTEGVDEGPVLDQARIRVRPGDTPDTLAERVLEAEHELYPRALAAFAATLRGG